MPVKIGTNLLSLTVQSSLKKATAGVAAISERLSTGQRINKAADDAAGLAIASSLNVDARIFNQGIRNLNDGVSAVNIADAAINELTNVVIRIEELAQQAANGSLSDNQRQSLQKEVSALQAETNRIIESTKFNERTILTGADSKTVLQGGYGLDAMLNLQIGAKQLADGVAGLAGGTSRVSNSSTGAEGNGGANVASISADGRYLVFQSSSSNLVAGDTNGTEDIFRKDLITGEIIRVNTSSSGAQGNASTTSASISADGRYVVFTSNASNLVAGDTNGVSDIFRKDLLTGEIIRVSTSGTSTEASGASQSSSISSDGRYVVFQSFASNLVAEDSNGALDIFRKDLLTGEILRVSTSSSGGQANNTSSFASISADGRYVAFTSSATNLITGDTNGLSDIFRKDLLTGEILRVSTTSSEGQANHSSDLASISADGRYIVFNSTATNLVTGDTNGQSDIFRKDILTGEILRVSASSSDVQGDSYSANAAVSADGRYVVFESNATNLVAGDVNGFIDIFRKDMTTGEIIRINTSSSGTEGDYYAYNPNISADGRYVVFDSVATNLITNDTNSNYDVFLRDLTEVGLQTMSGMVVSNQTSARVTLELAKQYREELTSYRSALGSTSSRLSTFISTLSSSKFNYNAASSRITDADIVTEAAAQVALNIKQQVAASLLAQANQAPQLGLKLLENL